MKLWGCRSLSWKKLDPSMAITSRKSSSITSIGGNCAVSTEYSRRASSCQWKPSISTVSTPTLSLLFGGLQRNSLWWPLISTKAQCKWALTSNPLSTSSRIMKIPTLLWKYETYSSQAQTRITSMYWTNSSGRRLKCSCKATVACCGRFWFTAMAAS